MNVHSISMAVLTIAPTPLGPIATCSCKTEDRLATDGHSCQRIPTDFIVIVSELPPEIASLGLHCVHSDIVVNVCCWSDTFLMLPLQKETAES